MGEIEQRKKKLEDLRSAGINPYPNDFRPAHTSGDVHALYGPRTREELENITDSLCVAGRTVALRSFGKASFLHIQDRAGRLQVYVRRDRVGGGDFGVFEKCDVGDIIGVTGRPFKTKTGELTIEAASFRILAKSLRPLPEKWHGLKDVEVRYRRRSLDLIVNPQVRETFLKRAHLIRSIRGFLDARDFVEVETPMMHTIPGGAVARPFRTHHNALNMDLYLRIAPELYLKRLVAGGLERVYEINRNFRNEGVSTLHNPEFTMLEFYQTYATYEDLMALTEELVGVLAKEVCGGPRIVYQGHDVDLTPPWTRVSLEDAVVTYGKIEATVLQGETDLRKTLESRGIHGSGEMTRGELILLAFDKLVQPHLIRPTFVTGYPVDVSPLARKNDKNPTITDRFELFIAGIETANAFSELNDPVDQRERFIRQLGTAGDDIPRTLDEEFLAAMEHGMPPTAGEGIGIDRLAMIFTNSPSIRDVILFPLLRPSDQSPDNEF